MKTIIFSDMHTDAKIEVTVERNSNYQLVGEAYFMVQDLCATVFDGEFTNPMTGQKYKVLAPYDPRQINEYILLMERWTMVDSRVPCLTMCNTTAPIKRGVA